MQTGVPLLQLPPRLGRRGLTTQSLLPAVSCSWSGENVDFHPLLGISGELVMEQQLWDEDLASLLTCDEDHLWDMDWASVTHLFAE